MTEATENGTTMTEADAREVLKRDAVARAEACHEAIRAVLEEHSCGIEALAYIAPNGLVLAHWSVVAYQRP